MKWLKRVLLSLLAIIVLSVAVVYAWGGVIINRTYDAQARNILPTSRPEILARGERLAQVFGCFYGCHGDDMQGEVFFEGWAIGKIISPNLTRSIGEYSRTELEAIIRQGVRPDGRSVMAMPSASFATMSDSDLSAILSFIDAYEKQDLDLGRSTYGLLPRFFLIIGEFEPEAAIPKGAPLQSDALQDPLVHGEYLARNACSECHGMDFTGQGDFTPPLTIARAYDLDGFRKLMSSGVGLGERELGVMSVVAENRFSKMTENEMVALYRFLNTL